MTLSEKCKRHYHAAMNIKTILQALGGPAAVGRRLGVRSQAVSLWAIKGRVPADRVPALLRLARERGVPLAPEQLRGDIDWRAVCECEAA